MGRCGHHPPQRTGEPILGCMCDSEVVLMETEWKQFHSWGRVRKIGRERTQSMSEPA